VPPRAEGLPGLLLRSRIEHAHQPFAGNQGQKRGKRLGRLAHAFERLRTLLDLGDVAVGNPLHLCHAGRRLLCGNNIAMNRKGAALLKPCADVVQAKSQQAVAAAEVMVEEGERRPGGEGMPERHLRQLDRHRVLVDAVHDALQDHSADEVLVVELHVVELPAALLGQAQDALANGGDALDQRRLIRTLVVRQSHKARRGRDRLQHAIGKKIDQRYQEVA
jgi:hypothetical protein